MHSTVSVNRKADRDIDKDRQREKETDRQANAVLPSLVQLI